MTATSPPAGPTMTAVTSSNIAAIGHHDGHLYVQFHPHRGTIGSVWRYLDAGHHHDALLAAASPGRLFHATIKGAHQGEKVS